MRRAAFAAVVLLVFSGLQAWEPVGPLKTPVLCGAASASDPKTMYVVALLSHGSKLMQSTDRGVEWTSVRDLLPFAVRVIAVDPADAGVLYVVSSRVHRSSDSGRTWTDLSAPVGMWFGLCVEPGLSNDVLIAGCSRIGADDRAAFARSTDQGETWQLGWCDTIKASCCYSILVDPSDTNTIYCGGYVRGRVVVYKTTDGGGSWTSHDVGVGDGCVLPDSGGADSYTYESPAQKCPAALLVSPSSPNTVFVGTPGAGLYRSTDGGIQWARHTLWALDTTYSLAVARRTPEVIYAGNGYNVLHSTNGGLDWEGPWSGFSGGRNRCVIVPADSSGVVFCGNVYGFFRGTAPGRYWNLLYLFQSGIVRAVTFSGSEQATAYAAVAGAGVYRSTDSGATWTERSHFPNDDSISGLASTSPSVVWAVTSGDSARARVVTSADSGNHWQVADTWLEKGGAITAPWEGLVVAVGSSRDSIGQERFGVTTSTDGGNTWQRSLLCAFGLGRSVAVEPLAQDWILAAGESAAAPVIYGTRDTGRSWQRLDSGVAGSVNSVLFGPWSNGPLVCGTSQGAYWSDDSGLSWSYSGLAQVRAIAPDWYQRLFYAATRTGVFSSDVRGRQWYDFNSGLANPDVLCLTTSPDSSSYQVPALAGTSGSGLFRGWLWHVGVNEKTAALPLALPEPCISPNPFRGRARISWAGSGSTGASVGVFDATGREVTAARNRVVKVGKLEWQWDARGLAAGTYFVRAVHAGGAAVCRAVLIE